MDWGASGNDAVTGSVGQLRWCCDNERWNEMKKKFSRTKNELRILALLQMNFDPIRRQ